MTNYSMPTLEQVRKLIQERPATVNISDIAKAADCSVSWLNQFVADKINSPGYDKIKAIVTYLNTKQE